MDTVQQYLQKILQDIEKLKKSPTVVMDSKMVGNLSKSMSGPATTPSLKDRIQPNTEMADAQLHAERAELQVPDDLTEDEEDAVIDIYLKRVLDGLF